MLKALSLFVVGVCANVLVGLTAFAQSPAEVTLTRIDCGTDAAPRDVGLSIAVTRSNSPGDLFARLTGPE